MKGNGKKRSKKLMYGGIALLLVLVIAGGLIAATRGGTKIDPTKLAEG